MGLFRGAVFHHDRKLPIGVNGAFPFLMGRFPTLMGRFPECLNGLFSLLKPLKNSPLRKGALRGSGKDLEWHVQANVCANSSEQCEGS